MCGGAGWAGGTFGTVNRCLLGTCYALGVKLALGSHMSNMVPGFPRLLRDHSLVGETLGAVCSSEEEGASGKVPQEEEAGGRQNRTSHGPSNSTVHVTWDYTGVCPPTGYLASLAFSFVTCKWG